MDGLEVAIRDLKFRHEHAQAMGENSHLPASGLSKCF
jgi:hypothetical protein